MKRQVFYHSLLSEIQVQQSEERVYTMPEGGITKLSQSAVFFFLSGKAIGQLHRYTG